MTDAILVRQTPEAEPGKGDEVRLVDLDPDRTDVIRAYLGTTEIVFLPLDRCRLILLIGGDPFLDGGPINLPATLLAYGAGRPGPDPIRGPVLVFGLGRDNELADVPEDVLGLFD